MRIGVSPLAYSLAFSLVQKENSWSVPVFRPRQHTERMGEKPYFWIGLALFGLSMFTGTRRAAVVTWGDTQIQWIAVFVLAALVLALLCFGFLRRRRRSRE